MKVKPERFVFEGVFIVDVECENTTLKCRNCGNSGAENEK